MSRKLLTTVLVVSSFLQAGIVVASVDGQPATSERDPTRPPGRMATSPVAQENKAVPELSSVLVGATRRIAVIDGKVMAEGEERGGVKVWQIKADRVVVSVAGRKPVTLMLDKAPIHKELR